MKRRGRKCREKKPVQVTFESLSHLSPFVGKDLKKYSLRLSFIFSSTYFLIPYDVPDVDSGAVRSA